MSVFSNVIKPQGLEPLQFPTKFRSHSAERTGSQRPVVNRSEQVTADTEEVLHEAVYREKPLRVRGGFESTHLPLALARRLMRDLRSIVLVLPGAVNDGRAQPRGYCQVNENSADRPQR